MAEADETETDEKLESERIPLSLQSAVTILIESISESCCLDEVKRLLTVRQK